MTAEMFDSLEPDANTWIADLKEHDSSHVRYEFSFIHFTNDPISFSWR